MFAAQSKNLALLTFILKKSGASVDAQDGKGKTALYTTHCTHCTHCTLHLIGKGKTALFYAARSGCEVCANYLYECGADVNHTDHQV
jgi:hypothetical protein